MPSEDTGDLQTSTEGLVEQHPCLELRNKREPSKERDRGEQQQAHDDLIASGKRLDRTPQPHTCDSWLDSLRNLKQTHEGRSTPVSQTNQPYAYTIATYQKQTPSSGHERKDANKDVLNCHVWDCYQDYDDGDKCYEYQPLDQPEHKLELCTESPPPNWYSL